MKDWDDFRFFQAVAKAGSLKAGAKSLQVNTTTVSRRITALEQRLEVRLFDRTGKQYLLTEAGEIVYAKLYGVSSMIGEIQHSVYGKDNEMRGVIRITCTPVLGNLFMADAIKKFSETYPDVICEILISTEAYDLSSRTVDIAIRGTNDPPNHLIGKQLETLNWAFYASKTYVNRYPQSKDGNGDEKQRLIAPTGKLLDVKAYKWLNEQLSGYHVVARVDNVLTMIEMAKKGIGIALLSGYTESDLMKLELPEKKLQTTLWLLTHPELRANIRIQTCMRFLCQEYKRVRQQSR